MSQSYERCIQDSVSPYAERMLSNFMSAYKKSYSSNHVLLRLIANWEKSWDNKNFVGTVFMDIFKAVDDIPHDLLSAKLHVYGLSEDAVTFAHSDLKHRKQSVKINDTECFSNTFIRYTTRFYMRPILFNILINDFNL